MNKDIQRVWMLQGWTRSLESRLVATWSGDWKFLLNFFLNYRKDSVGSFKKWAKMGFPRSEVENSLDPRHVGFTVAHAISVLERTRCAPVIFFGDAVDEPLKASCTRGRTHPLCFQKHLLYIHYFTHNNHPPIIYRAQVTHLLHFLLLLQITCKKTLYLLSHPLLKGEGQGRKYGKLL